MAEEAGVADASQSPEAQPRTDPVPAGKRAVQSCAECKRRKIRCSRTYPCHQCINRGPDYSSTCEKPEIDLPASHPLTARVTALESIVRAMQDRLDALENGNSSFKTQSSAGRQEGSSSCAQSIPGVTQPQPSPMTVLARAERGQPEEEETPLLLEDFAMGFLANQARTTRQLHPEKANSDLPQPHSAHRTHTFLLDRQVCWSLINIYFHRLEWYTKCLHTPSVLAEASLAFNESLPAYQCSSVQAEQVVFGDPDTESDTRASFLCILQLVQCIALHLLEPHEQVALKLDEKQCSAYAHALYSSAKSLIWSSDWLQYPSLEWLQAIVLLGVYAYDSETEADVHWALLGTAIKVAQNLGLSRLGAENDDSEKWPAAWKSFRRRETGRRVWWNLATLDWSHAQAHNGAYAVHPSQNHTVPPYNVKDSDLTADIFLERPMSEYTESSMTRLKVAFVETYRQLVDHLNTQQSPDYAWVVEMDNKICQLIEAFPHHFSDVANADPHNPTMLKECLLIRITAANHQRYAASKDRCVSSARAVLALVKIANQRCAELMRLWIVIFYAFVASVVCFIDLTRCPSDSMRDALTGALEAFRHVDKQSAAARNAAALLSGLLTSEQEFRNELARSETDVVRSKKRRLSNSEESATSRNTHEDAFRRVVLRLLSRASEGRLPSATAARPNNGTWPNHERDATGPVSQKSGILPDDLESFFSSATEYGLDTAIDRPHSRAFSEAFQLEGNFAFGTLSAFNE
ncbi:hypothetical protein OIV83_000111 [Microbotryomycetes sp. JL201]|nr:hypothetical protein OIV83_000111 [Microbotryomycetes sp. JL201]